MLPGAVRSTAKARASAAPRFFASSTTDSSSSWRRAATAIVAPSSASASATASPSPELAPVIRATRPRSFKSTYASDVFERAGSMMLMQCVDERIDDERDCDDHVDPQDPQQR